MGNFSSLQISSAGPSADLLALRAQVEAPSEKAGVQANTGGRGRITFDAGGRERVEGLGLQRVEMATPLRPGMVLINGQETSRAAAIAAGFLTEEESEDPLPARRSSAEQGRAQDPNLDKAETDDAPPEIANAGVILSKAADAHGPQAVEAALSAAAASGELPTALPEGMSPADAQAVWDGYHAQAENTLGQVGASVSLINEMLTDEELGKARIATLNNDRGWLQDLGSRAIGRLERLPQNDASRFAEALATMSEADRKMVVERNGVWRVNLPAPYGEISWGQAVRRGLIKF